MCLAEVEFLDKKLIIDTGSTSVRKNAFLKTVAQSDLKKVTLREFTTLQKLTKNSKKIEQKYR